MSRDDAQRLGTLTEKEKAILRELSTMTYKQIQSLIVYLQGLLGDQGTSSLVPGKAGEQA